MILCEGVTIELPTVDDGSTKFLFAAGLRIRKSWHSSSLHVGSATEAFPMTYPFQYEFTLPARTGIYDPNPNLVWRIDETKPERLVATNEPVSSIDHQTNVLRV